MCGTNFPGQLGRDKMSVEEPGMEGPDMCSTCYVLYNTFLEPCLIDVISVYLPNKNAIS